MCVHFFPFVFPRSIPDDNFSVMSGSSNVRRSKDASLKSLSRSKNVNESKTNAPMGTGRRKKGACCISYISQTLMTHTSS